MVPNLLRQPAAAKSLSGFEDCVKVGLLDVCRWVWVVPLCIGLPLYLGIYHDLQLAVAAACILIGFVLMPPSQVTHL